MEENKHEIAELAKQLFEISENPRFSMSQRDWDDSSHEWFANPKLAKEVFGWQAQTDFSNGLLKTKQWYNELELYYAEKVAKYIDSEHTCVQITNKEALKALKGKGSYSKKKKPHLTYGE